MSIVVSGIKLPADAGPEQAIEEARRACGLQVKQVTQGAIYKKSFDLRKRQLHFVYAIELTLVDTAEEEGLVQRLNSPQIRWRVPARMPAPTGRGTLNAPPIVVGFGPAGMFAALILAERGYCPLVLERGESIDVRDQKIEHFFRTGELDENTNIQFGEGGAGAYSDGKLTTRINDNRCELVLEQLLAHGAPQEVKTSAKPHIGTDLLKQVVMSIRKRIKACGGDVRFNTPLEELLVREGRICGVRAGGQEIAAELVVLATGHSARDLFESLHHSDISMEAKAFSVGVRAEHLQWQINQGLYGPHAGRGDLPPGEYTLANQVGARGCYSFCMCPGGQVIAAASQAGGVVTNGMSYHARDGMNANAALVVTVNPNDFEERTPLSGVAFQRGLERRAFQAGGGDYQAPIQLMRDFVNGTPSARLGRVQPTYCRGWTFSRLDQLLPAFVVEALRQSIPVFGRKLRGYDSADVVLTGLETRTSSPVRILRRDNLESPSARGLIPCGEGAGYAGGIMSAAVDGVRAAEKIMAEYTPKD